MTKLSTLALAAAFAIGVVSSASAYQVTGPILELTDSKIVVQKGKEKWELARTGTTELPADAKVGDKVTIEYGMNAEKVEVKGSAHKAQKENTPAAKAAPAAPAAMKAQPKAPTPAVAH
ncbi:MAG: hypothetical protein K2Q32_03220 [Alphaproteobacteria bacterium]|nr:hypothetical protein [Alphaproteobacteria bacterium]